MNFINDRMQEWMQVNKDKGLSDASWAQYQVAFHTEYDRLVGLCVGSKWAVGFKDRGLGHGDFAVVASIDGKDELVVECPCREVAEHIVEAHNATLKDEKVQSV